MYMNLQIFNGVNSLLIALIKHRSFNSEFIPIKYLLFTAPKEFMAVETPNQAQSLHLPSIFSMHT